ncbi:Cytoplasmic tRNA 2-thiolation protein 1, partial [Fragariocoptes setiger]
MKRPKNGRALCKECFYKCFEQEIHETISTSKLFNIGDYVAIGASGGKDSTVLAYIMNLLNERHNYGLKLVLLSIDEGITGYRDDSLKTVERNKLQYGLPLKILSYKELYGWTMDDIVKLVGLKNNCTICGVFRRQALDRGAHMLGCNKMVTGHNADDVAETVLMNLLRGDTNRLERSIDIVTKLPDENSTVNLCEFTMPRAKPFKYTYEKEIVLYAHFKKLDYFSTECIYAPNSYRGHTREFLKDIESIRPSSIIDIIRSGESFQLDTKAKSKVPDQRTCITCGYISSQEVCKACMILEGLNKGRPKLGLNNKDVPV